MNAHSFSMINLCVAFGFAIVNAMGIFGNAISSRGGIFNSLLFLTEPVFSIPGVIEFSGVEALALALAALTVVILNTNLITDKGAAMAIYAVIFYGSVFTIGLAVFKNFDYLVTWKDGPHRMDHYRYGEAVYQSGGYKQIQERNGGDLVGNWGRIKERAELVKEFDPYKLGSQGPAIRVWRIGR